MFKWVYFTGVFLVCSLLSIQGFSAQLIKVEGGGGGGLGLIGPKGEAFVFYGEAIGEISIKECITNRTFFENGRSDCTQKEGTQIETFSQTEFKNHFKFVLNLLSRRKNIDQLKKDQDKIKPNLTQIEKVILNHGTESADIEEKQALEFELAQIELQLEFLRDGHQWIDDFLMGTLISSESFFVYNFAEYKYKMDFKFDILRIAAQLPRHSNTNELIYLKPVPFFLMGSPLSEEDRDSDEHQHHVTLDYAFEMQATEETQLRWVYVMGYNPSYFQEEKHCPDTHITIEIRSNIPRVSLCPTHPVESVSWWSAVVYANRLSELRGLASVYDLSDMGFKGTAAKGTLKAISGELKINALVGDDNIYNTEGFRLPTEAEWEYAARAGTTTPFGLGKNISVDMANYSERYQFMDKNSIYKWQTVPVTSLSSSNGWGFSHMHGNVLEWVHDWYNSDYYHDRLYKSSIWDLYDPEDYYHVRNPLGPSDGFKHVLRGGSWGLSVTSLRSANRSTSRSPSPYDGRNEYENEIGFRLVRTAQ